jgi:poly(3-hydroxybutyrate) depolymerase
MLLRTPTLMTIVLLAACGSPAPPASEPQKSYNIDPARVTVSGISSGAYMAGQLHVAHASLISGAALLAGGPYACAGGSMQTALGPCIKGDGLDQAALADRIETYAGDGRIDDPQEMQNDRVWIFHGKADQVVNRSVSQSSVDLYRRYIDTTQIAFVDSVEVVHGMPTLSTGVPCDELATPFLNACNYDAAGELLQHLYGPLNARVTASGELGTVDQAPYADAELWDHAFVYAPDACQSGAECGMHVAFHGCQQSAEFVGDAFARGAGFNEWAEANRIVVFYPQVKSSKFAPLNPLGCWDWWGYTNEHYATKNGLQVTAVRAMIDQLMRTEHR